MKFLRVTMPNLTTLLAMVSAKMSPVNIRNVMKEFKGTENTLVNPILGHCFETVGGVHNLRFYDPSIEIQLDKNHRRIYHSDKSNEPFIQAVIELFKSPAGIITHVTQHEHNFGKYFSNHKDAGILFFGKLFASILCKDVQRKSSSCGMADVCDERFLEIQNMLASERHSDDLKLMLIHSFIINTVDSESELKAYIQSILDEIIDKRSLNQITSDENLLDITVDAYESFNFFPYSPLNPPLSNESIPVYNRDTGLFDETKTFSDCADITLLHICNCLFYNNADKKYSLKHLKNASPELKAFYDKHSDLFTLTKEIRKEWSNVIQDLPPEDDFDIVYVKDSVRNEVKSGTVNMMKVLARICGIQEARIFSDIHKNNLEEKLQTLFKAMFTRCSENIRIDLSNIKEFKNKSDFKSEIQVEFNCSWSNSKSIVRIVQQDRDAYLQLVSQELGDSPSITGGIDEKNLQGADYTTTVLRNYFRLISQTKNDDKQVVYNDVFSRIYLTQKLESNELKKECLEAMFKEIQSKSIKNDQLKTISRLILSTVELNDLATLRMFKPFFYYTKDLFVGRNEELVKFWISFVNLGYDFIDDTIDVWTEKMVRACSETKELNLTFNVYETLPMPPNLVKQACFLLDSVPDLKTLTIKRTDFGGDEVLKLKNLLSKTRKLETLDLQNCQIGVQALNVIADCCPGLQSLNLSYCDIKFEGEIKTTEETKCERVIAEKFINLRYLNVSWISIELPQKLASMKNMIELIDLEERGFTKEEILSLIKSLPKTTKLRKLTLRHNVSTFQELEQLVMEGNRRGIEIILYSC